MVPLWYHGVNPRRRNQRSSFRLILKYSFPGEAQLAYTDYMRQRKATILQVLLALSSLVIVLPVAPAEILPDLVIETARIEQGIPSRLRIKVANIGLLAAAPTQLTLQVTRQGETVSSTVTTPLLKTGDRQWMMVVVGLRPVPTDHVLLRIDDPDWLEESDENNNAFVFQ